MLTPNDRRILDDARWNENALQWWRMLSSDERRRIHQQIKPDWTFEMFTASTSWIRKAYLARDRSREVRPPK